MPFERFSQVRAVGGHVFRVDRRGGPVWYAKYRLPDGRQAQCKIGPAWCRAGRPAAGFFTKRTARSWLDEVLAQARAGTLPGMVRTGVRFSAVLEEWLRFCEEDRSCKPSTMRGYRNASRRYLLPAFGELFIEDITGSRWPCRIAGARTDATEVLPRPGSSSR